MKFKKYIKILFDCYICSGRERGIRTPGSVTFAGFQDRCIQPLYHLPIEQNMEVPPGFEPGIAALQAAALPLGDGTTYLVVPGTGLEPARLQ